MKKVLLILAALFLFLACQGKPAVQVDDTPIESLNLSKYLGTWYEIARIDHRFEKGMGYTQARYILEENGSVRVENSGLKNGKYKQSIGKAKRPDPLNEPALLRVSFFWPFYSDYRVLMVDPDYQYALVSSKGPDYLWIMSRESHIPDMVLQAILQEANQRGFDTSRLVWVTQ